MSQIKVTKEYSRLQKDVFFQIGSDMTVHGHKDFPDTWFVSCNRMNWDRVILCDKSNSDADVMKILKQKLINQSHIALEHYTGISNSIYK